MNKTLRNKALRNVSRLITADMNGEDWACPDGYFATAYPIYDGYKMKTSQWVPEGKPKLHEILPTCEYTKIDLLTEKRDIEQIVLSSNNDGTAVYTVQVGYYDLLMNIYPDAIIKIANDGNKYAPVEFYSDGALVAVIMPLKS